MNTHSIRRKIKAAAKYMIRVAQYALRRLGLYAPYFQDRVSIAARIDGPLGDTLVELAWLKEMHRHLDEKAHIDVYGRAEFLAVAAYRHSYIKSLRPYALYHLVGGYDLKLRISHLVLVDEANIPRLAKKSPKLSELVDKLHAFAKQHEKYTTGQPQHDGAWADFCVLRGWNRWDELGASGAIPFSRKTWGAVHINIESFPVLETRGLAGRPYITIHAGGDRAMYPSAQGTKIWPLELWGRFARLFKERYPHITIMQLGGGHHSPVEGADLVLCGQTSLAESAVILKQALLHIDGESGLVHLRRQLGGQSVVLFGPTPKEYFAYENNVNIVSPFCSNCLWKTEDWALNCPRGFARPECMLAITPESVVEAVGKALDGRKEYVYAVSQPAVYSSAGLAGCQPILDDIRAHYSFEKKPISEHMFGPGQTYIHASRQWEYPYAVENINSMGRSPLRMAVVGGGRGALAWYLAQKGHKVTVYDLNYLWDDQGNADVENQFFSFARAHGFEADFGSVFNIPAEDETFDVVTCISVVEHILWKEYAIKEMLRVLKPGGKLILTYDLVLTDTSKQEASRVEIFTPQAIRDFLKKFGIDDGELHSAKDVLASMDDIRADSVNIAPNMTVGGFVLGKSLRK